MRARYSTDYYFVKLNRHQGFLEIYPLLNYLPINNMLGVVRSK